MNRRTFVQSSFASSVTLVGLSFTGVVGMEHGNANQGKEGSAVIDAHRVTAERVRADA
jgi:hypothetical protein